MRMHLLINLDENGMLQGVYVDQQIPGGIEVLIINKYDAEAGSNPIDIQGINYQSLEKMMEEAMEALDKHLEENGADYTGFDADEIHLWAWEGDEKS